MEESASFGPLAEGSTIQTLGGVLRSTVEASETYTVWARNKMMRELTHVSRLSYKMNFRVIELRWLGADE